MASKSTPPAEDPPLPEDVGGLEEALTNVRAQRASLSDSLGAHPVRERRLLERQAPEEEIAANDMARRRIIHGLGVLDGLEREIRNRLIAARADHRQIAWLDIVDQFEEAAGRLASSASALQEAQRDLCDVARRAAREGFNEREHAAARIPFPSFRIDYAVLKGFQGLVEHLRRVDARAPAPMPLFLVRFTAYTILRLEGAGPVAYQARDVAGFDARTAWDLVDQCRAAWADESNIPQRPQRSRNKRNVESIA